MDKVVNERRGDSPDFSWLCVGSVPPRNMFVSRTNFKTENGSAQRIKDRSEADVLYIFGMSVLCQAPQVSARLS